MFSDSVSAASELSSSLVMYERIWISKSEGLVDPELRYVSMDSHNQQERNLTNQETASRTRRPPYTPSFLELLVREHVCHPFS